MSNLKSLLFALAGTVLGVLSGCSDSTAPRTSPTAAGCSGASTTQLAAGSHVVIDPSAGGGCVRLPAAGASGARHLLMAFSGTGQVTDQGLEAPFLLSGTGAALAAATARSRSPSVSIHLSPAQRFHNMLRARGRELLAQRIGRGNRLNDLIEQWLQVRR